MKTTRPFIHAAKILSLPLVLLALATALSGCKDKRPKGLPDMSEVQSVSPGLRHTCAVRTNHSLWCWGRNFKGRLGIGDIEQTTRPVAVDLDNVAAVEAGAFHSCAVTRKGFVFCWGHNGYGECGDGTTTHRSAPVEVKGVRDVRQLTTFAHATCALDGRGAVWCWGSGAFGMLGQGDLKNRLRPTRVSGLKDVIQIDASAWHICAATKGGEAWCWGQNQHGETGNGTPSKSVLKPTRVPGLAGVTAVAAGGALSSKGGAHGCALLRDGSVRCWGSNAEGQLGDGTKEARLAPVAVKGLKGARSLSAGYAHTCAVDGKGQGWCWGRGQEGQLGTGISGIHLLYQIRPTRVTAKVQFRSLVTRATHTCGVTRGGKVYCWGAGASGQLGGLIKKNVFPTPEPVLVSSDY